MLDVGIQFNINPKYWTFSVSHLTDFKNGIFWLDLWVIGFWLEWVWEI